MTARGGSGRAEEGQAFGPGEAEGVARILVLRQLDARSRTRSELERYLARKGVPDEAGRTVLDRFSEVGLIDDRSLAAAYVSSAHETGGLARRALAVKLRQRGVADDIVDDAVSTVDSDSEAHAAEALVRRKLRSMAGLEPTVQTRRLVSLLARKGYSPGLAYRVVREQVAGAEELAALDLD